MFVGFEAKLRGIGSVLGSNPWILNWRSLNQNHRKDDLSDWLLTGDSCDNHPAATLPFNYFGCNYFLAFSSPDWGLSHQTMKANN